jgi:hypothetical protein
MKEEFNKHMENLRKKSNRNSKNEKFLISNKKISRKPLQQTRTSGRQNLKAQTK